MTAAQLIQTLRAIFPKLSPDEQRLLVEVVEQLRAEAAEREVDKISDPDMRAWAKSLNAARRVEKHEPKAIDLPPDNE